MKELQNLYALSELAQHIIKDLAKRHSWALQSFPMKVKLPAGILRPLPNVEATNKVLNLHSLCLEMIFCTMLPAGSQTSVSSPRGTGLARTNPDGESQCY
jgi:hypothetical protein